jgi:spore maturation protein CgeB
MSRVYSDFLKGCARIAGAMDGRAVEVLVEEELETHLREDRQTVLWVGARYDYGNRDWGLSFEHYSFFHTLMHMGYSLIYFDYDRLFQRYGRRRLSEILRGAVYYYEPTILLYFHYLDWIDHDVFREISLDLPTKTVVWLADDHWRYEETRPVWKLFNTVVTTSIDGYERRRSEGFTGVVLGQWGATIFFTVG